MNSEGKRLADIVKRTHKRLRKSVKQGHDVTEVWREHVQQQEMLQDYASAMHSLATNHWTAQVNVSRVAWAHAAIKQYFHEGEMDRITQKEMRKLSHLGLTLDPNVCGSYDIRSSKYLHLLDVGSCYNPFAVYTDYEVTAIDLCPANSSVKECDFLNVEVVLAGAQEPLEEKSMSEDSKEIDRLADEKHQESPVDKQKEILQSPSTKESFNKDSTGLLVPVQTERDQAYEKIRHLTAGFYDVVVFSFLLEYIPSPGQRFFCCTRAYQLLKHNGLLCILTPDSKHQNANVHLYKLWKITLGFLGFSRVKYEKLSHFHGMVFRKGLCRKAWEVDAERELASMKSMNVKNKFESINYDNVKSQIYIPQDFQELSDSEEEESKETSQAKRVRK